MGRVIEVVSGQAFDAFLKARLFDPLGMTSTYFQVPASEAGRLSTNYVPMGGVLLPIDPGTSSIYLDKPPMPSGGGGLVSSARDRKRGGWGKGVSVRVSVGGRRVIKKKKREQ